MEFMIKEIVASVAVCVLFAVTIIFIIKTLREDSPSMRAKKNELGDEVNGIIVNGKIIKKKEYIAEYLSVINFFEDGRSVFTQEKSVVCLDDPGLNIDCERMMLILTYLLDIGFVERRFVYGGKTEIKRAKHSRASYHKDDEKPCYGKVGIVG